MKKFKDPCWKDYEMVGMKDKNGKKVPNCVPVEEEVVKKTPTEVNSPHNAMAFDGPYTKAGDVKDKSGAIHKAMSRARDLARKSLAQHKKVKENGHVKEDVEQIDEISKSTLGSYIKAASHDVATKGALTRHHAEKSQRERDKQDYSSAKKSMDSADKTFAAGWKRRMNMAKAVDRLTKEEVEQFDESVLDKFILAKGIDPSKLSRDKKLVHAKSKDFSDWKSERKFNESYKAEIVKEAWKKAKSKLTETGSDSGADDEAVQAPKKKKSNGKDAFNKDPVLSSAITKPTESA
jgi:hypothetical protein